MTSKPFASLLVLTLISWWHSPSDAEILVVHADGSGEYPTIQAAIDAAVDGDEVVLTAGVFRGDGNREIRYHGKAITVRGEGEVEIDPQSDIVDVRHAFTFIDGEGPTSRLEDVRIRGGWHDINDSGTTVCQGSSPSFTRCTFTGSQDGTAVYSEGGEPTFVDCQWIDNYGSFSGPAGLKANAAILRACRFEGNHNSTDCGAAQVQRATISDCVFTGNAAGYYGGSLCVGGPSVIEDSAISGWAEYYGGAVYVFGGPAVFRRCDFGDYPALGPAFYVAGGCVTLQACSLEEGELGPPDACVRRINSHPEPVGADPLTTDATSWGQIKAEYR